uniref:GIY-YIG endonuclease n=1 Tax=Morchella brunnea TaxID=1174671 RepID=A0A8K1I8A9_9PEZI|nr:GIY-YIG endonuclease [Morchella brunnea]UBU98575.1 GIY-YIG endonuclease [Morchella brunnea]
MYNVPIYNISNPISPLLSEAGRMMKVLSVKAKLRAHSYYYLKKIIKFWFKTVPVTSRRGLNLINLTGVALFIYIFFAPCFAGEAIVLVANLDALFIPDANFYLSISSFSPLNPGTPGWGSPAPVKSYENAGTMKNLIIKENENKSGIYRWTNKYTGDTYIGQSTNLSARFIHYFNTSYLTSKKQLIISRALIKYGYSGFSLEILLEFCEKSDLLEREQYYLDRPVFGLPSLNFYWERFFFFIYKIKKRKLLKPEYNILKIAGSSLGFKHSEDTKAKISKCLKGIYVGKNSGAAPPLSSNYYSRSSWTEGRAFFGRVHSEETKVLMSIKKLGDKNHNFGRTLSEETKELIRLRAQGRIHSEETKALISQKHGNPVNVYEKVSGEFSLIGSFVSKRKAAQFLEISAGSVTRYMQSGKLFKDKYKFSTR